MAKKIFKREYLLEELDLPHKAIDVKLIDRSRWEVCYKMIFYDNGKYYRTYYWTGATEYQYCDYFHDEEDIECEEVKETLVEVLEWLPVED